MLIPFEHLQKRYGVKPKGILHCGANRGEEAEAYDKAGVNNVIWIEANPVIYETLKQNINKYPGHVALNFCIGDEDGKDVIFHIANNDGQSSSFLELGTHAKNHPTVKFIQDIPMKTHRIDTLLRAHDWSEFPMDYLSMDLQGCEGVALKGMGLLLEKFKWVYLEVNRGQVYRGNMEVGEIDQYLKCFGFRGIAEKWTGASWGDKLYIKR
jgi:FkbM family methyltransferase